MTIETAFRWMLVLCALLCCWISDPVDAFADANGWVVFHKATLTNQVDNWDFSGDGSWDCFIDTDNLAAPEPFLDPDSLDECPANTMDIDAGVLSELQRSHNVVVRQIVYGSGPALESEPRPVRFSAKSKITDCVAPGCTSCPHFMTAFMQSPVEGIWTYQVLEFPATGEDLQTRELYFQPPWPIEYVIAELWLAASPNTSPCVVEWDDIHVDLDADPNHPTALFDSVENDRQIVLPAAPQELGSTVSVATDDEDVLELDMTAQDGALARISFRETNLVESDREYTGGFLLRDAAADSDIVHFGGDVSVDESTAGLILSGSFPGLHVDLNATITPKTAESGGRTVGYLEFSGSVEDTATTCCPSVDRAVTLYFALPVDGTSTHWIWGNDIRSSPEIEAGGREYRWTPKEGKDRTFSGEFVDTQSDSYPGVNSAYPWSSLTHPALPGAPTWGLSLAYPIDHPRQVRLIYNAQAHEYFIAFDLGLTYFSSTPRTADFQFILYAHRTSAQIHAAEARGFRAAAQLYYDIFPKSFQFNRGDCGWPSLPPCDGLWVGDFAYDKDGTMNSTCSIGGSGLIRYDEVTWNGYPNIYYDPDHPDMTLRKQVRDDDLHKVLSFRYLTEPFSEHIALPECLTTPCSREEIMAWVNDLAAGDEVPELPLIQELLAQAALTSGIRGPDGEYVYHIFSVAEAPWCAVAGGDSCAVFDVDPDPDIPPDDGYLSKGYLDWDPSVRKPLATYDEVEDGTLGGTLDGEYIDSYQSYGWDYNFMPLIGSPQPAFAATSEPPTFDHTTKRVVMPALATFNDYGACQRL